MQVARTIYDNGRIRVRGLQIAERELVTIDRVRTQTGCIVVPVALDGRIILVREFRHGAGTEVIGVVKGAKDREQELDEETASRELLEELGMSAARIVPTKIEAYALPSLSATRGRVVYAYGCVRVASPDQEPDEQVSIYAHVTERELADLLRRGVVNDAESCMALQAYLLERMAG